MRILALIPARSGSRGLKNKNVRKVGDVPMLVRAIRLAQLCRRHGEDWSIVVSTESDRYARLACRAGAEVPFMRPRRLATNRARLIDAVLHAIDTLERDGRSFDLVVMLSAATPLTDVRDVRGAVNRLKKSRGESMVSVTMDPVPSEWRFRLERGRLVSQRPGRIGRRQASDDPYRLNGAIYVATPRWLRRHRQFLVSGKTAALVMPRRRSVDVEDGLDLAWAEFLLEQGKK
ncbi:MAG: acylneuraminate cytidylyltransferase family protein [Myxococcota bacterium]